MKKFIMDMSGELLVILILTLIPLISGGICLLIIELIKLIG